MGHAVGHISGIQCRAADGPGQRQRGGACVQIDEILCRDEGRRRIGDGPLFGHGQALLGSHGGLIGPELAVRQGGPAVDFIDFAQTVQLVQIPADGGLAGIQGLAQLLHGGGTFFRHQRQDLSKPFFCQHRAFLLFDWF